jgi:hypothetical protein
MPADKLSTELQARKPDLFAKWANWIDDEEIPALLANMYCNEVTPTERYYTASLSMDDNEEIHSCWTEKLHGATWYLSNRLDQEPTEAYKAESLAEKEAGWPYPYDNREYHNGWDPCNVLVVWEPEPTSVASREWDEYWYTECRQASVPSSSSAASSSSAPAAGGGKKRVRSTALD